MLKFSLGFLVLANVVVYAWNTGYLGSAASEGREPGRTANQLNAQFIMLVDPFATTPPPAVPDQSLVPAATPQTVVVLPAGPLVSVIPFANPANPAAPAAAPPALAPEETVTLVSVAADTGTAQVTQCIEVGNFDVAEAARFSQQLVPLALGERLSRRGVRESERYIVYIPPLADKAAAERKAGELRRLGITDFYVMADNSDLRMGISLGIFKTADAARQHLASLMQKGVHSARVGTRSGASDKTAFQLRRLDPGSKEALTRIRRGFPRQEARSCVPA